MMNEKQFRATITPLLSWVTAALMNVKVTGNSGPIPQWVPPLLDQILADQIQWHNEENK